MAHNVEKMAFVGETPWHGLGKRVSANLTPQEMLVEAGLDWEVEARSLFVQFTRKGETKRIRVPERALFRSSDDKYLTKISAGWNPVQNADAFAFFDEFVKAGEMQMHTAGSLCGGQLVWGLAKIDSTFDALKGDTIENFLLFTNPHRYGKRCSVSQVAVRVVCWNTHKMALDGAKRIINFDHRAPFDAERVKEAMGIARHQIDQYKETTRFLTTKIFGGASLEEFLLKVFPKTSDAKETGGLGRQAKRAIELIDTQPGHEFAPGTWWQAYNAVTYFVDHEMGRSQDNRLQSAWYGWGSKIKEKALVEAIEFAKAA